MIPTRRHLIVLGLSCGALASSPEQARADVAECVTAHSNGQAERNAGRLMRAKEEFVGCAGVSCPVEIRSSCASLLTETEGSIPTLVFTAIDAQGRDVVDVKVSLNGLQALDRLTGLAMPVDPGTHQVGYTWPDGFEEAHEIVATQGEKNRRIEFRRAPPKEPSTPAVAPAPLRHDVPRPLARGTPALAYVLGGLGLVALGGFTGFALSGKTTEGEVDKCKPRCPQSLADKMRVRYLIADISLGVSLVSLGAGGYLFLSASREPSRTAASGFREAGVEWRGSF